MFDQKTFDKGFKGRLDVLGKHEAGVREAIIILSRDVLVAVHATGQIGYVNQMLAKLTPVNRNASIEYFKTFTGFSYDEATRLFTTKSKKRYNESVKKCDEFLADPLNNLFSWAQRAKLGRAEPEFKPVEFLKRSHTQFMKAIQTARDHGIGQKELFEQMFKNEQGKPGVDVEALIAVLAAMGEVNVVEPEEALM